MNTLSPTSTSSSRRTPARWRERAAAIEARIDVEHASSLVSRAVSGHLGRTCDVLRDLAAAGEPVARRGDRGDAEEVRGRLRAARSQLIAAALLLLEAEQALARKKAAA